MARVLCCAGTLGLSRGVEGGLRLQMVLAPAVRLPELLERTLCLRGRWGDLCGVSCLAANLQTSVKPANECQTCKQVSNLQMSVKPANECQTCKEVSNSRLLCLMAYLLAECPVMLSTPSMRKHWQVTRSHTLTYSSDAWGEETDLDYSAHRLAPSSEWHDCKFAEASWERYPQVWCSSNWRFLPLMSRANSSY